MYGYEIRTAQAGEEKRQKEIWEKCFQDSDEFIERFYTTRYDQEKTMVLLQDGEIASMLTMLPITVNDTDGQSFAAVMLYAIATHPDYRQRGLATRLLDYTHEYLRLKEYAFSVLVPAEKGLFDFYRKQGYREGFGIRETVISSKNIESFPRDRDHQEKLTEINPQEYNRRRNLFLGGSLHISYLVEEIAYQQELSRRSGADIYGLKIGGNEGCAAIERIGSDKIMVKEILIKDEILPAALRCLLQELAAAQYLIRTPLYLGQELGGVIRPFGMLKPLQKKSLPRKADDLGYLGLAFD